MSGNACACDWECDGEYPDVYSETFPVAKKEHACYECGSVIPKGQTYQRVTGLWEGQWDTFKVCMACYHIRTDLFECSPAFGELRDAFQECMGFDYLTPVEDDGDEDGDADGS